MMNRIWQIMVIAVVLLQLGCELGPEPAQPQSVAKVAVSYVNIPKEVITEDPNKPIAPPIDLNRWWNQFADPITVELVDTAMKNNTDLRIAAARVMQARGLLGVATGHRLPSIGANMGVSRSQTVIDTGFGTTRPVDNQFELSFNASWQVDVFGKLKRNQQAAWHDLLASEARREAVMHSVIAEVVRTRVQIAIFQRQLDTRKANTASWINTSRIIERRYQQGLASVLALRLAKENLASSKALEPEIENVLKQAMHRLDVLLGKQAGTGKPLPRITSELPDLTPVPLGLPAALLDRRPDLRSSEFRAAADTARIGAAIADLYPDLTLSATGGWRSNKLHDLIDAEQTIFRLASDVLWRVWAGGSLRANVDIAKARAEEAAIVYAQLVLNALREVEDTLVREETAKRTHKHLKVRLTEATAAERIARDRYQRGVEPLITVLETERRRRNTEFELIQIQGVLWQNRVNLYLALGGDWMNQKYKQPENNANNMDNIKQSDDNKLVNPQVEQGTVTQTIKTENLNNGTQVNQVEQVNPTEQTAQVIPVSLEQ